MRARARAYIIQSGLRWTLIERRDRRSRIRLTVVVESSSGGNGGRLARPALGQPRGGGQHNGRMC